MSNIWSDIVLALAAMTLIYAASMDLREFRIRNEIIIILGGLFVVYSALSRHSAHISGNVGLAAVTLVIMLYYYHRGAMGGGDVKLLAVAFLWVGIAGALPFSVLLVIFMLAHAGVAKLGGARYKASDGGTRIPLAPSVCAALIGTFLSAGLQSSP